MAITQRLQQGFLRLPFARKVLLVSSAALMLAPVLPWYDFRNRFGVGESLNGLQGPLFLVGWLVMGMGALTFFNMFFPLLGRNFFELKKRSGLISLIMGGESLLLVVLANTVFFHPSYSDEASRGTLFGVMLALASATSLFLFGAWVHRHERNGQVSWGEESAVDHDTFVAAPAPAPIPTPVAPAPVSAPHFESTMMERSTASIEPVSAHSTLHAGVDPLTLDAKTRYRLMQSQMRRSMNDQDRGNMWGSQPHASSHSSESSNSLY